MTETATYTFSAYSVGGFDFAGNTITFSWPNPPPADTVTGLYDHFIEVANPDPITGQFAPGDYFNSQFVNLLTGTWDRYPLGMSTTLTDSGYVFVDMVAWTGGELEVVSETKLLGTVGGHNVPEPATMALMPLALGMAYLIARWRARMVLRGEKP